LPNLGAVTPKIFVAHGQFDPVIPIQAARNLKQQLENAGLAVTYQEFSMGHGISEEVITALLNFLSPILL
jgi:phospholipase/carboxylesterase